MPVFGVGVDLVSVPRIARLLERFPDQFARRILHASEYTALPEAVHARAVFLAKRFAAKEAAIKALGMGGYSFHDIQIQHDRHGKPGLTFSAHWKDLFPRHAAARWELTLSDEPPLVVAVVLVLGSAYTVRDTSST